MLRPCFGMLFLVMVVGCGGPHSSPDAPPVTVISDSRVKLDPPVIQLQGGNLGISGSITRKAGWVGDLYGRIDLEFIGPDGNPMDGLPVLFSPTPLMQGQTSTYQTLYGFIPPKGSTLRVHFVDGPTMAAEDLEGGMFDAGPNSTGMAGGAAVTGNQPGRTVNHYSANHQMGGGFGSNFGSHNFGPGGHR